MQNPRGDPITEAAMREAEAILKQLASLPAVDAEKEEDELEIDDEEDNGEVYAKYVPQKVKEGVAHPTDIVETASLAAVPPPDATYRHHIQDIVKSGWISGAQLETVIYAQQRFNQPRDKYIRLTSRVARDKDNGISDDVSKLYRPGFYLGDGAGVGKGRQIAACIAEHWRLGGRRILWLSVSNDLKEDAKRDIYAVGLQGEVPVFPEGKSLPQGNLARKGITDGVLYMTYSLLISGAINRKERMAIDNGMDVGAVGSDFGTAKSRLKQVVRWLRGEKPEDEAEPLIILDECHKAKNLVNGTGTPTATGLAVVLLQNKLPNAKVLYSSATGATEPKNLAYMTRVGYWGYDNMEEFLSTINNTGLGAMEMLAMSLKSMGIYVSRTLSYSGATFKLSELDIGREQLLMYDRAAVFWQMLYRIFFPVKQSVARKRVGAHFWAAHMRFFRQMLIASKVPTLCERVNRDIAEGNCCVIGLQSTGEAGAKSLELLEGEGLDDMISAPRLVLINLVKNFLPKALCGLQGRQLETLLVHVKACIDAWAGMPSIKKSAAAPQGAAPADRRAADGVPGGAGEEDDDVPEITRTLTVDEVLAERRDIAMRTGMFIDLTKEMEPGAFAAARDELEKEDDRERQGSAAGPEVVLPEVETDEDDLEILEGLQTSLSLRRKKGTISKDHKPPGALRDSAAGKRSCTAGELGEGQERPKRSRVLDSGDSDWSFEQGDDDGEANDTPCVACGSRKQAEKMLLCDGCDVGYHIHCLAPPLEDIPDGDWFCHACVGAPSRRKDRGGAAEDAADTMVSDSEEGDLSDEDLSDEDVEDEGDGSDSDFDVIDELNKSFQGKAVKEEAHHPGALGTAAAKEEPSLGGEACGSRSRTSTRPSGIFDIIEISDSDDDHDSDTCMDLKPRGPRRMTRAEAKRTGGSVIARPLTENWAEEDPAIGSVAEATPEIRMIVRMVLRAVDAMELPPNPLDEITDKCGGPSNVAEMTGRSMHIVRDAEGGVAYKRRVEHVSRKDINLKEMADFMDGKKMVAIISDAASTGISLHADKGHKNKRKRVHYTLELPWSADKAIQQFGRSHRSNQVVPPTYDLLISKCGGERRFASCAARRLMSLGALTKGDRRAMGAGSDLKEFEIDEVCGKKAIRRILEDIKGETTGPLPGVPEPRLPKELQLQFTKGEMRCSPLLAPELVHKQPDTAAFYTHMQDCCLAVGLFQEIDDGELDDSAGTDWKGRQIVKPKGVKIDRFLNRMLGLRIEEQQCLFKYFEDTYQAQVKAARSKGEMTGQVVKLSGYTSLECVKRETLHTDPATGAVSTIATLRGDKRVSWADAMRMLNDNFEAGGRGEDHPGVKHSGFYEYIGGFFHHHNPSFFGGKRWPQVMLATYRIASFREVRKEWMKYNILKPFGQRIKEKSYMDMMNLWKPISQERAEQLWTVYYTETQRSCYHGQTCTATARGRKCTEGMRETMHIVEGALLPIWKLLMDNKSLMSYSVRKDQQKEMKILQIIKADLVDRGDANSVEDANANARQQQRQQAGSVMGLLIGEGNVDKLKEAVAKMV